MEPILNITNGDSTVEIMRLGNIPGHFLPWRDVLHDGPVPCDLEMSHLSRIRAEFIALMGWADLDDVVQGFEDRDNLLTAHSQFEKVILWFEHDLYDQLQLLQILDWFGSQNEIETELSLICTDRYLGHETPETISELWKYEIPVTETHLQLAGKAWTAFRQSTPESWAGLLEHDSRAFPFLSGAVERVLEEYPDSDMGLSRTARVCLEIIRDQELHPGRLFRAYQDTEERMFMGDLSFWVILEELLGSNQPLIQLPDNKKQIEPGVYSDILSLTEAGSAVLQGEINWLEAHAMDRWIGGVHLTPDNRWCWDSGSRSIARNDG